MADDSIGSIGIRKVEFITLIAEALQSLGYSQTLSSLEAESSTPLSSSLVFKLTQLILDGMWDESLKILTQIPDVTESVMKSACFLILEQKFLKLIGEDKRTEAMETLRNQISPLSINHPTIRELAPLLSISSSGGDKIKQKSNTEVLKDLQKLFAPNVIIPHGRLMELLEQAIRSQHKACVYHNSLTLESNLFVDHDCGRRQIPCHTLQTLNEHHDEVSCVQFSHNGKLLASCSKDGSVIIWQVSQDGMLQLKQRLEGHAVPVCCVLWNPTDDQVITCGIEETVRRWDVDSGECEFVYRHRSHGMISCCWSPNGQFVYTMLTTKTVAVWRLDGNVSTERRHRGPANLKIADLQITGNGKFMVSIRSKTTIAVIDREVEGAPRLIEEDADVVSFVLSSDHKFLLVSLKNLEIQLWKIDEELRFIVKYIGRECSSSVVRACFGGVNQGFIANGSEDGRVFVWHRETGELLYKLRGHSGSVTCTSWNPTNAHMLASGGSDGVIRIWVTKPKRG